MTVASEPFRAAGVVTPSRAARGAPPISVELAPGECLRLVGPNGCGKTELTLCIAGRIVPVSGRITRFGEASLGLACSAFETGTFTVDRLARATSRVRGGGGVPEWTERWELAETSSRRFSNLSRGQRSKALIALATLGVPRLAILDEVLAPLDDEALDLVVRGVADYLAAGGSVIVVEHRLPSALPVTRTLAMESTS